MSFQKFQIVNKGGIAHITIIGEINWWENSSQDFTRLVDRLLAEGCVDVEGYICTPGGSVFDANEIGNQIQRFPGRKILVCGALVASAGTLIATYFDEVEAASNTQWMIHDIILRALIEHLSDFDSNKKMYENLRNNAIDRYHTKTKIDKETLSQMMMVTTWLSSDEARVKGFVDRVRSDADNLLPTDMQDVFNKYKITAPERAMNILNAITNFKPNENEMKEIALKLGLPENATSEQIIAALSARDAEMAKLKGIVNSASALVVDMAVKKGMKKETVDKVVAADFGAAVELVMDSTPKTEEGSEGANGKKDPNENRPITAQDIVAALKEANASNKQDLPEQTFSQMWEKNPTALKELFAKNEKLVEDMYTKEYGAPADKNELKNLLK